MNYDYEPVIGKIENVLPVIGGHSLIGVGPHRPCSRGNYFSLADDTRIWNFWAENLRSAVPMFLPDNFVRIVRYTNGAIILDRRIPENWYYNKLCFTGGYGPSIKEAREIYDILGDPDNEFEQFVDPVSYWKKRGGEYNPVTGIVRYTIGKKRE